MNLSVIIVGFLISQLFQPVAADIAGDSKAKSDNQKSWLNERFKFPRPIEYKPASGLRGDTSNYGRITIHANFARHCAVGIAIDHYWAYNIADHQAKTYLVLPGTHEVQVATDFSSSEPLMVHIEAEEARDLVCGNLSKDEVFASRYGANKRRLKKLYYLRQAAERAPAPTE